MTCLQLLALSRIFFSPSSPPLTLSVQGWSFSVENFPPPRLRREGLARCARFSLGLPGAKQSGRCAAKPLFVCAPIRPGEQALPFGRAHKQKSRTVVRLICHFALHSAEDEGFEPPIPCEYNAFRMRRLKPLGQSSGAKIQKNAISAKEAEGDAARGHIWRLK